MLSVIILTLNSKEFIESSLKSVLDQGDQDLEVIVIDNGSADGTATLIKENYPQVILIENKKNLGAAKAKNQGIELSKGGWVLTLDCDTVLEKNFFSEIIKAIEKISPDVGAIQPKILNIDRKTIFSTGIFLSATRRFYDLGKGRADSGQFALPKYVFGACCAAAVYNRQMLLEIKEETGYFDERFFFLAEDVDLSWRAQKKKWKALFIPEAVCYHKGNSSGTSRMIRQYLCFRNRYFMIFKNENSIPLNQLLYLLFIYDVPRILYIFITNRLSLRAFGEIINFIKRKRSILPVGLRVFFNLFL